MYAQPMDSLIGTFCSIIRSQPMLLMYLNDHVDENHASPAAYLFFLKLFTLLEYPMITFHFFHPLHPAVRSDAIESHSSMTIVLVCLEFP